MTCTTTIVLNMAYHPPHESQNRVDAIKKKFEEAENKPEKPAVKRTPAFRCDRIVCGKNVTNIAPKSKPVWAGVQSDTESKKSSHQDATKFKKSYSDHNLQSKNKKEYNVKFISHEKDILGNSKTNTTLPQYSVVKKKKEPPSTEMSEKIRLALQSPLPVGPPPKKPPRIFTHTPQKEAKTDARLKLEKLENFILKHEKNSHVIVPRKCEENIKHDNSPPICHNEKAISEPCGLTRLSCLSDSVTDDDVYILKTNNDCALNSDISDISLGKFCDKGASVGLSDKPDLKDMETVAVNNGSLVQPIYAQPFKRGDSSGGSTFQTFGKSVVQSAGKSKRDAVLLSSTTFDKPLHYMCTDLNEQLNRKLGDLAEKRKYEDVKPLPDIASASGLCTSTTLSPIISLSQSLLSPSLSPLAVPKPSRTAPSVPLDCHPKPKRPSPPPLILPTRKTSSNSSSPPNVSPSSSPLGNVRRLMDKVFGRDSASWDSDEASASGQDTPEDTPSLDLIQESIEDDEFSSTASAPSLNSIPRKNDDDEDFSRLTSQRKGYVKRVSSHLLAADRLAVLQSQREKKTDTAHLFESCLLIGLTLTDGPNKTKQNLPYVKSYFPPQISPPPLIEYLCFPDADSWPTLMGQQEEQQAYSIVLTNERGERKFGYCRRVLPEGSDVCLPLAYCIISLHRATGFYYKVLHELESRHGTPESETLMKQLYENEFPNPGQSLKLHSILERAKQNSPRRTQSPPPMDPVPSTLVRRPADVRLENRDVMQLFRHLSIPVFLKVFSSILLERKVLLLGNSLSILSCCIEGLQSILYPFSWQHTYVPVLPAHLLALCEAPTPYIIGVLKNPDIQTSLTSHFTEGMMVDLEDSRIIVSCKDEGTILPSKLRKSLRSALTLATTAESTVSLPDSQKNVLVSEAFLRFFVEVCGHFGHHITTQSDGSRIFQKEAFIRATSSSSVQNFLEWFTETALFHVFIKDRVDYDVQDLFWKRSLQHSSHFDKNLKSHNAGRKVKSLSDRLKDFTTFSK